MNANGGSGIPGKPALTFTAWFPAAVFRRKGKMMSRARCRPSCKLIAGYFPSETLLRSFPTMTTDVFERAHRKREVLCRTR